MTGRRTLRRRDLLLLAALGAGGAVFACHSGREPQPGNVIGRRPSPPPKGVEITTVAKSPQPSVTVVGEPQCLVTKSQGLPPGYVPADLTLLPARMLASNGVKLRPLASESIVKLIDAAGIDGQGLFILSGFRTFQEQDALLQQETKLYGRAVAEQQVAPPGHSEHQLGLAADITSKRAPGELSHEFGRWPEGRWLAENAPRFGFVISYPEGKEGVTGYIYEPWHIRYVGAPLAEEVAASGLTLTEFLPKHNLVGPCP